MMLNPKELFFFTEKTNLWINICMSPVFDEASVIIHFFSIKNLTSLEKTKLIHTKPEKLIKKSKVFSRLAEII